MNAWGTLFKKEYRTTRNSFYITLSIILIGGLWIIYLSHRPHAVAVIAPLSLSLPLIFLIFYPAIYMLKSLTWEWKVTPHLWLHCPQPAWMLLSAKLVNSLLHMLVLMLVLGGLLLWTIFSSPLSEQLNGFTPQTMFSVIMEVGLYAALSIFAVGIYIGAWATLVSTVNATARNILGRFRWLAGVAVFLVALWGIEQLRQTWLYEQITRWGSLDVRLHSLEQIPMVFDINLGRTAFSSSIHLGQVYAGEIIFYVLLTLALFALSAWLIDNKVEV